MVPPLERPLHCFSFDTRNQKSAVSREGDEAFIDIAKTKTLSLPSCAKSLNPLNPLAPHSAVFPKDF